MIVGWKDAFRLIGISIVTCAAVFVCTLFLSYNLDLVTIQNDVTGEAALAMYDAQRSMGKAVCVITGGSLVATSVILLFFYIKNYIDAHGREIGILKAMGYSEFRIAKHFWVFGGSVFAGCFIGGMLAILYMPTFYRVQNAEGLFPEMAVRFHPVLMGLLVFVPTLLFMLLSVLYARLKLSRPALDLLRERQAYKFRAGKTDEKARPFLQDLKRSTLRGKKILVFFVLFSAFCFSAMTQMALSMKTLASETMAWMILVIGLILAFMTLLLSLSSVVKANAKTIAMMRVCGYSSASCGSAILGCYRPASYIGFAVGTVYQYALLKIVIAAFFGDVVGMPEYHFHVKGFIISLALFVVAYEAVIACYVRKIKALPLKSVMME